MKLEDIILKDPNFKIYLKWGLDDLCERIRKIGSSKKPKDRDKMYKSCANLTKMIPRKGDDVDEVAMQNYLKEHKRYKNSLEYFYDFPEIEKVFLDSKFEDIYHEVSINNYKLKDLLNNIKYKYQIEKASIIDIINSLKRKKNSCLYWRSLCYLCEDDLSIENIANKFNDRICIRISELINNAQINLNNNGKNFDKLFLQYVTSFDKDIRDNLKNKLLNIIKGN